MTTMLAAERDVLAEVTQRIIDLEPDGQTLVRFMVRTDNEKIMSSFEESDGIARLFEIGTWDGYQVVNVGKSYNRIRCDYPIKIWYPNEPSYLNGGAASDAEMIQHDLLNNPATTDGIEARYVLPDNPHTITPSKKDGWFFSTTTMTVFYSVTAY